MHSTTSRGARTERRILQAAFELFLEQGYHGTSMRQVARRARITPAAIYNHFDSKESLFVALLWERVPHRAILRGLAAAEGDSVDALVHDALDRMQTAAADQFDNFRLMFIELLEFKAKHAEDLGEEFIPQLFAFVERLHVVSGAMKPMSDVLMARAFFGLFFSYVLTGALFQRLPAFGTNPGDLQSLGDIFLSGVLKPD